MAKFGTLIDSFSGVTLDPQWTTTGASAVFGSGVVTLNIGTPAQNNLLTVSAYDLTASSVHAKLTMPATDNGTVQCSMRVASGSATDIANEARWFRNGELATGNIDCRYTIGGVLTIVTTLAYSPVDHAWLRLREAGGTLFWDSSPDAITWTNRASTAAITWSLANCFLRFTAVRFGAETPAVMTIDNVNVNAQGAVDGGDLTTGDRLVSSLTTSGRGVPDLSARPRAVPTMTGGDR